MPDPKKKKTKSSYSHISGKPYNYKEHGWLSNLTFTPEKSSNVFKDFAGGVKILGNELKKDIYKGKKYIKKKLGFNHGGKVKHFKGNKQYD